MLILTRRPTETIYIGDEVTVTVLGVIGNQVRFGIDAPRQIAIDRKEIRERKMRDQGRIDGEEANGNVALPAYAVPPPLPRLDLPPVRAPLPAPRIEVRPPVAAAPPPTPPPAVPPPPAPQSGTLKLNRERERQAILAQAGLSEPAAAPPLKRRSNW